MTFWTSFNYFIFLNYTSHYQISNLYQHQSSCGVFWFYEISRFVEGKK